MASQSLDCPSLVDLGNGMGQEVGMRDPVKAGFLECVLPKSPLWKDSVLVPECQFYITSTVVHQGISGHLLIPPVCLFSHQ
jgi:hypothetical protein